MPTGSFLFPIVATTPTSPTAGFFSGPIVAAAVPPPLPPTPAPVVIGPGFRERDIWQAIKVKLDDLRIFDHVYVAAGEANHSPEDILSVELTPYDGAATHEYDDTNGELDVESRVQLVFKASYDDPFQRASQAELVMNMTANALNGKSIGNLTWPGFTLITNWRWGPVEPPHQKITAILKFRYDVDTWAGFNTSE